MSRVTVKNVKAFEGKDRSMNQNPLVFVGDPAFLRAKCDKDVAVTCESRDQNKTTVATRNIENVMKQNLMSGGHGKINVTNSSSTYTRTVEALNLMRHNWW